MNSSIEALYIFDELNTPILEHAYRGRPPPSHTLLSLFLQHPAPRPSLLYLPDCSPPISVFSVIQSNLLFLVPSSSDVEPLLVLEFLHRVIDVLEEFVGAPLLASKIQSNYEVVAQLLNEMCDAGVVCCTEPNALAEVVQRAAWMDRLLSGVGINSSSPSLGPSSSLKPIPTSQPTNAPAIPWRRPNVRHTSNELYVDIVESLSITLAPSGRVLSALATGTIVFTAKISGVPDLLLLLSAPGGAHSIGHKLELPVFHPCVRLATWRENPGELSFVPPDGRFVLAGYEVDLLPLEAEEDKPPNYMEKLFLPATVDLQKGLGVNGNEFEVRLTLNTNFPGSNVKPGGNGGTNTPSFLGGSSGNSNAPVLDEVVVHVPVPRTVRNITDIRPSRGEASFMPGSDALEWKVPTTKDSGSISGTATLRCTVVGPLTTEKEAELEEAAHRTNPLLSYYDESLAPTDTSSYQTGVSKATATSKHDEDPSLLGGTPTKSNRKPSPNASLMPSSVSVSFSVRGWLPSGIRVDKLLLDPKRSRGLGESVKPYKGVKYLCSSKKGVERRC